MICVFTRVCVLCVFCGVVRPVSRVFDSFKFNVLHDVNLKTQIIIIILLQYYTHRIIYGNPSK